MIRSGETTASVTPRAAPRPAPKAAPAKPEAAKAESRSDPKAKAEAETKPDPAVMRAQRALSRLGYGPLKDDGLMGPGTRAAIERFERDRKLPIKGEATGRTLRALTTKAAQG
ncbi:peptidoglycan-binding domain-containing protein [Methylobacterium sp. Leaf118]|uniref:peptidoglycan-binding domain-containing protein n=1 Tax=Methylobacterium sp. Leaf118 TaxID=2876562 RepID=UPI001E38CB57|nr:peptidoglycan-binding domain-containing protein [Methylobacterium sp. Leaf118]